MQLQIAWKNRANRHLNAAVEYSLLTFGQKVAGKFYQQVKHYDTLLATNPHIGAPEPLLAHRSKEYRSVVVHELYKLVYYIDGQHLYITALWDLRREPKRLTREVKEK